jgi:uncharacterized protein YqgV (UPF0045/DUF77 family)
MAVLAAFSIAPGGGAAVAEDGSVGPAVAEIVKLVRASGLPNETNAMFTNVEGDWDEVMALIKACVDHMSVVAPRVSVVIKLDIRAGHAGAITEKVATVERHIAGG